MERKLIKLDTELLPKDIQGFTKNADIYDSSCSPEARVYFLDKDCGYYLKVASKGTLYRDAQMTGHFYRLGLGAQVVSYISDERDYLLTTKVSGEDCTYSHYLDEPKKLCDKLAQIAQMLHSINTVQEKLPDRTAQYLAFADKRYREGAFDNSYTTDKRGIETADNAMATLKRYRHLLKSDCLIHGDFCLPNIMMSGFEFSGFIDVGHGGLGDRHIDLFWGAWSLAYNLKTDKYTDRFFDAYGRDKIDTDRMMAVIAAETFG